MLLCRASKADPLDVASLWGLPTVLPALGWPPLGWAAVEAGLGAAGR